jgi:hypothetical protein
LLIENDLQILDLDLGKMDTLLAPGQGGQVFYSPNGSQIAITIPTSLSLFDADGLNRHEVLTYTMNITYSEYQYHIQPLCPQTTHIYAWQFHPLTY